MTPQLTTMPSFSLGPYVDARAKPTLDYCPSCRTGSLEVVPVVMTSKGDKDVDAYKETIEVGPEAVSMLLGPLLPGGTLPPSAA